MIKRIAMLAYVAFVVIVLASIWRANQPAPFAVEPACAPQPNPCATMSCKPRIERNLA